MPSPNSTDSGLETTFANLAFARLKDKAPGLINYLIGFQLIDKNEDETHAIGVFGFNVGDEWVYAPVFFINGELKGHELMYVKSQDAFVPMTEEWVNYILNRKPSLLGETESRGRHELGLRQPDFDLYARAPFIGSKYGSANKHSFNNICEQLVKNASKDGGFSYEPFMKVFTVLPSDDKYKNIHDVPAMLKHFGKQAGRNLLRTMRNDEKFADAITQFYAVEDLIKAADEGPHQTLDDDLLVEDKKLPVVVITRGDDPSRLDSFMSDTDKQKLMKDEYVVKDDRSDDQRARLYKSQIGMQLQNPSENGYYQLVNAKGNRMDAIVITSPQTLDSFRRTQHAVVIDPKAKKYGNYYAGDVYVSQHYENSEWKDVFDGLPAPTSLRVGDVACIIGPKAQGTQVFEVTKKWTNGDGQVEMSIRPFTWVNHSASNSFRPKRWEDESVHMAYPDSHEKSICLTDKEGTMQSIGNTLFIPSDFKAVKLEKSPKYSMGGTMDLGTLADVTMQIWKTANAGGGMNQMRMLTDGSRFQLELDGVQGPRLTKVAMIKDLILDKGFSEDDALYVINEAKPRHAEMYYVKLAYQAGPGPGPGSGFSQPEFNAQTYGNEYGLRAQTAYPQTEAQNLSGDAMMNNRQYYEDDRSLDDDSRHYAESAARTGQKEVLDTSVISGLVKTVDSDSRVDSYIADLLLGLDRIGRILFMFYWHNDKFKERYGQQDMAELEDSLRNVFKQLGELTMFLKAKTIDPDRADSSEADLDQVMN